MQIREMITDFQNSFTGSLDTVSRPKFAIVVNKYPSCFQMSLHHFVKYYRPETSDILKRCRPISLSERANCLR